MQSGLTAQEERAFAAIVNELEPKGQSIRVWHLLSVATAWVASWVALFVFVEPLFVAFSCFLAVAAITALGVWAIRQVTTESAAWDRTLSTRDRFKLFWRNLTD